MRIVRSKAVGYKVRGLTDQGEMWEVDIIEDMTFSECVDDSEQQHRYIETNKGRAALKYRISL